MPEIKIQKPEDIKKLIGWTIDEAEICAGNNPAVVLKMHNIMADKPVKLSIIADVSFGRSGNIMVVNSALTFRTEDCEVPDADTKTETR